MLPVMSGAYNAIYYGAYVSYSIYSGIKFIRKIYPGNRNKYVLVNKDGVYDKCFVIQLKNINDTRLSIGAVNELLPMYSGSTNDLTPPKSQDELIVEDFEKIYNESNLSNDWSIVDFV